MSDNGRWVLRLHMSCAACARKVAQSEEVPAVSSQGGDTCPLLGGGAAPGTEANGCTRVSSISHLFIFWRVQVVITQL